MAIPAKHKQAMLDNGFAVIKDIYAHDEVASIVNTIQQADTSRPTFRKSTNLFAIRQFLKEIPQALSLILNPRLKKVITELFGDDYFIVKSIYFDKPGESNWFVAYHQDLTISVDRKIEMAGFGPWSVKQDQYAVQPPLNILQANFTIRIHLDDTDESNGSLRVVPGPSPSNGRSSCSGTFKTIIQVDRLQYYQNK